MTLMNGSGSGNADRSTTLIGACPVCTRQSAKTGARMRGRRRHNILASGLECIENAAEAGLIVSGQGGNGSDQVVMARIGQVGEAQRHDGSGQRGGREEGRGGATRATDLENGCGEKHNKGGKRTGAKRSAERKTHVFHPRRHARRRHVEAPEGKSAQ